MSHADPEKRRQYHHEYYLRHRVLTGPYKMTEEHRRRLRAGASRFSTERAAARRALGETSSYPYTKVDGRLVRANRLAWEQANGRALLPGEVVHHIDGDRFNNDPANLLAMTQADHIKLHDPRGWDQS